jgi:Xaa-Pro aminopeptidase
LIAFGPPLFLFSRGHGDAEFIYATGMDVEEAVYLRFGEGDDLLVVSPLELERARLQSGAGRISDWSALGWTERQDRYESWAEVVLRALEERDVAQVTTSPHLFAAVFEALQQGKVAVAIDRALLVAERRRKSAREADAIRAAQRAAEAACVEVIRTLAAARPGRDGLLHLDGRPLTSEYLMARAQFTLNELGHATPEMIVAGSPECALPHFRGEGPIRADGPVIIDIFPMGQASHYHGDLTRTVVPGTAPEEVRRMHEACVAALEVGLGRLKAGVNGREVHRDACRVLVERGFGTTTAGLEGDPNGPVMNHSLGHGVGLEVHEPPSLRDLDYPLQSGDVLTVEPGLYKQGLGGVRVEDTGRVTERGFENFTRLPYSLEPGAYLD